jgi:hypothetical protein
MIPSKRFKNSKELNFLELSNKNQEEDSNLLVIKYKNTKSQLKNQYRQTSSYTKNYKKMEEILIKFKIF